MKLININAQAKTWKLRTMMALGLGLVALINMIVSAIAYSTNSSVIKTITSVGHTHEVKSNIRLLEKVLVDAETGQRGFIFAGSDSFLEPYDQSLEAIDRVFQDLYQLTSDNPLQTQNLDDLRPIIDEKIAELNQTIRLKKSRQEEQLMALVKSELGKRLMDEIRSRLHEMYEIEDELLLVRQSDAMQARRWMQFSLLSGTISLLFLIFFIYRLIENNVILPIEDVALSLTSMSSQLASTIEEQENVTSQQAASMSQTTATISELAASSQHMASQAESSSAQGKQVITLTETGQDSMQSSIQKVTILHDNSEKITHHTQRLESQTAQIGLISNLVSEIAMQTELLALNAAIEAVRAGENGKGFGVVASEIRKLADQSKHSATQINGLVQEIKQSITATTKVTAVGTEKINQLMEVLQSNAAIFETVVTAVHTVVLNSQQIAANVKQQDIALQQITEVVTSINQGAAQTVIGIGETRTSTEQLKHNALTLSNLV
ncbi:CHASE3 domain-containing protein [Spirulina major]|uniref:CHASE3 domain-containing protein n=1 Tax=Spirulina major TaxID=270636 RepID=UPI000933454B|nr:CHASE3 domain-containing protein [Spirulina major]